MSDAPLNPTAPFVPTTPAPEAAAAPLAAEALPARYALEGELARGGMGLIVRVHDRVLGRTLALKVLHENFRDHPDMVQRFLHEAHVAGQLQHPGIAPLHDLGRLADGRPFFTMKLVRGQTLADRLAARGSGDDLAGWLPIFEGLAQTIAYAHSRGVLHRDLKPANVMVGAFGEVQVMDWGLAKVLPGAMLDRDPTLPETGPDDSTFYLRVTEQDGATRAGSVLGTPAYMAPEQARGEVERIDERADVFGLGAILCQVLTGRPPYQGTTSEVMRQARQADLARAFEDLDSCGADAELIAVAKACLAPDPQHRLRHAGEVARAVAQYRSAIEARLRTAERERAVAQERAAQARAAAAAERRLRRRTLGLAAAVLLLLVVGSAAGLWWLWQRDRALVAAEAALEESIKRRDENDWSGAIAAARRAELLLPPAAVPAELRRRIAAAGADAEMARELDAIHLVRADRMENDHFGPEQEEAAFTEAFRRYGLDVDEGDPADLAEQVRSSAIRDHLVFALDAWARGRLQKKDSQGAARLLAIALKADPDPWRNAVRHPATWQDRERLQRLARRPEALDQPATCLALLGDALGRMADSPESAVELLEAAQRKHPGDFWLNHELAYYLQSLQPPRPADALGFYRAALAVRPGSPGVHHNLGRALLLLGRLAEAESSFRRAIALQDNYSYAHNNLAVALLQMGRLDEAEAELHRAIAANPGNASAHANMGRVLDKKGDLARALAWFRKAAELAPRARQYAALGVACYRMRRLPEAIAALRQAARLGPTDAAVHGNLGLALTDAGDHKAALDALDVSMCLDPDSPITLKNRALACARLGRHDEAIEQLQEVIRRRPGDAQAHTNLSVSLLARGEAHKARAAAARAVDLDSKGAANHLALGKALAALGRDAEAARALRRASELDPKRADSFQTLAAVLVRLGRWREAVEPCRKALALEPGHAPTRGLLATALLQSNDLDGSALEFRKLIGVPQWSAVAHANLGVVRMRQQRWAEAERHLRESVRLDPNAANARCDLGTVLLRRGEYRQASTQLRKAIQLDGKFVDAYLDLGRALRGRADFAGAVDACERGMALLDTEDSRRETFERERRQAQRLLDAEGKLPAILAGKAKPADANERLLLAHLCQRYLDRHAAAARFYAEVFAEVKPADVPIGPRYLAACSAARAAAGLARDAAGLDEGARARLRQQALAWLEAELALWKKVDGKAPRQVPRSWLEDEDLAGVRSRSALKKLPAEERAAWLRLWAGVRDLAGKQ
jgi:serine/threonine-protein kinase